MVKKEERLPGLPMSTKNELVVSSDFILSERQSSQLALITTRYLRQNNLPASAENFTSSARVVTACVKTGLTQMFGRVSVADSDDMKMAYKLGYDSRSKLLYEIEENISDTTVGRSYKGSLALPSKLVYDADEEIKEKVSRENFFAGRKLNNVVEGRAPIFRLLISKARDLVESSIPGSRDVQISKLEEAGLVRNVIFSLITSGQPTPIIDISDILKNFKLFNTFMDEKPSVVAEIIEYLGLDGTEAEINAKSYITDLVSQIQEYTKPGFLASPKDMYEQTDALYRLWNDFFLLADPFSTLPYLSDDVNSKERNLWDTDVSHEMKFRGKIYRFPKPEVLMAQSYRLKHVDPRRSDELSRGATVIRRLFYDIKNAHSKIEEFRELKLNLAASQESLLNVMSGESPLPEILNYSEKELSEMVSTQEKVISSDLRFFQDVKTNREHYLHIGQLLYEKYKDGRRLEPDDYETLWELYMAPGQLSQHISIFFRERVAGRIVEIKNMHAYEAIENSTSPEGIPLIEDESKVEDTTLIDILLMRSNYRRQTLKSKTASQLAQRIVGLEEIDTLYSSLRKEIAKSLPLSMATDLAGEGRLSKFIDKYKTITLDKIVERRRSSLLSNYTEFDIAHFEAQFDRFAEKALTLEKAKVQISTNQIPSILNVDKLTSRWRKRREINFDELLRDWKSEFSVSGSLERRKERHRKYRRTGGFVENFNEDQFARSLKIPNGPLLAIAKAMLRLVPQPPEPAAKVTYEQAVYKQSGYIKPNHAFIDGRRNKEEKKQLRMQTFAKAEQALKELYDMDITSVADLIHLNYELADQIERSTVVYDTVFESEIKVRTWLDRLMNKLSWQKKSLANLQILRDLPSGYLRSKELEVSEMEKRLVSLERQYENIIPSRLRQIASLRLLKEV